jgi:hypothetical protein
MARIRTVKPAFFLSRTIAKLPLSARLTFIGLWTYVDDDGRGVDDARLIKGALWALDDRQTTKKVGDDLAAIEKLGLIERYTVDGAPYLRVRGFREHQRINRPQESKLPASPEEAVEGTPASGNHGSFSESAGNEHGTFTNGSRPEGKGRERKGVSLSLTSESHPAAGGRGDGERRPRGKPSLSRPALSQRLAEICTGANRGRVEAEAVAVVEHCWPHVDPLVIDEAIGAYAERGRPSLPRAVVSEVQRRASAWGVEVPHFAPARNGSSSR